jgi:hypothetical protein
MVLKHLIISSLLLLSLSAFAEETELSSVVAPASSDEINMSEPPFWMSSYEEFKDLQQFQKDLYLEKLLPYLSKIPALDPVTKKQLQDATEWYQDWNRIRVRVYRACQDKEMLKTCEEIADIRLQALDLLSNQKEENRKANETSKPSGPKRKTK